MADVLGVGDDAPPFALLDQHESSVDSSTLRGRRVFIYFYPKADTSGCTTQASHLRDLRATHPDALADVEIIGVSPDPPTKLAKFDDKHSLGFTLLSDPDHQVAEAYGAWGPKKLYGREYDGIIRSAVLIGSNGVVTHRWPKLSPKQTSESLMAALAES